MIKTKAASSDKNQAHEHEFQAVNGKRLLFCFDEPELTGDAGLLALAEFEKGIGLFGKLDVQSVIVLVLRSACARISDRVLS